MIVYRVHYWDPQDGSRGFWFTTDKRKAKQAIARFVRENELIAFDIEEFVGSRDDSLIDLGVETLEIEMPIRRQALVDLLNDIASHPNNG